MARLGELSQRVKADPIEEEGREGREDEEVIATPT